MAQVQEEKICTWNTFIHIIMANLVCLSHGDLLFGSGTGLVTGMQRIVWPGVKCIIFGGKMDDVHAEGCQTYALQNSYAWCVPKLSYMMRSKTCMHEHSPGPRWCKTIMLWSCLMCVILFKAPLMAIFFFGAIWNNIFLRSRLSVTSPIALVAHMYLLHTSTPATGVQEHNYVMSPSLKPQAWFCSYFGYKRT